MQHLHPCLKRVLSLGRRKTDSPIEGSTENPTNVQPPCHSKTSEVTTVQTSGPNTRAGDAASRHGAQNQRGTLINNRRHRSREHAFFCARKRRKKSPSPVQSRTSEAHLETHLSPSI